MCPKHKPWRPADEKILGTRPDSQIALLLGRTLLSVVQRRRRLGIPNRWSRKIQRPWTAADDRLLGTGSDPEIAKILGRSTTAVCQHRQKLGIEAAPHPKAWTEKELALLGTMPDKEAARLVGRAYDAVRAMRLKLGKPCVNPAWKPWTAVELGIAG